MDREVIAIIGAGGIGIAIAHHLRVQVSAMKTGIFMAKYQVKATEA